MDMIGLTIVMFYYGLKITISFCMFKVPMTRWHTAVSLHPYFLLLNEQEACKVVQHLLSYIYQAYLKYFILAILVP